MGFAYAKAFLKNKLTSPDQLYLYDVSPERAAFLTKEGFENVYTELGPALGEVDVLVIAVKPQMFGEVAKVIRPYLKQEQLVISIMAGIKFDRLKNDLGVEKLVRGMPNTPCQLGRGVTGYAISDAIKIGEISLIDAIFESNGRTVLIPEESQLDAVTGVSGSGPAYFFYILRAMIEAGMEMGLEERVAALLVKQTLLGSFYLTDGSSKTLEQLQKNVTSKGGTTEAAINKMMELGVAERIKEGMKASRDRAVELSELLS